jgi:hypothetical protein
VGNLGPTGAKGPTGNLGPTGPALGLRTVRIATLPGSVSIGFGDDIVVIKKNIGAATIVNLPAFPEIGRSFLIKDGKGDAQVHNITILPATGTIDGAATVVISQNYAAVSMVYDGIEWRMI